MSDKKIIITGYPYAFPYYFHVFEYAKDKSKLFFVLPEVWKSKKEFHLEKKAGFTIRGARVLSYGRGSFLGGLFKGWMPALAFLIPYFKFTKSASVIYTCQEPNLLSTFYNAFWAKLFGLKHVIFTWQNIEPEKRLRGLKLLVSNWLVKSSLSLCDGVICGNKKAEDIIKNLTANGHKPKTIVCPLSGVDTERFSPLKLDGRISDKKTILFYGALDKRKGVDVLLEAFGNLITARHVDAKLIIVGTGSEKERLVGLAGELIAGGQVEFHDWMSNDQLPKLLNSSDVFVYPSVPHGGWEEQFGYAMAEASACEVPVVATNSGSISEVVLDGRTGILVSPNDSRQLAGALSKVLNDPELSRSMGKAGREYVLRSFSHDIVLNKILNFINTV